MIWKNRGHKRPINNRIVNDFLKRFWAVSHAFYCIHYCTVVQFVFLRLLDQNHRPTLVPCGCVNNLPGDVTWSGTANSRARLCWNLTRWCIVVPMGSRNIVKNLRVTSDMGKSQVSQLGQLSLSSYWVVSCNRMSVLVAPSGECLRGEGIVWLIGAVACVC